ncbi:MAG: cysteine hydrolase family protein [Candidatus Promineifilaceae bacterium]|jgi:nicotinamidase-related amidase
MASIREGSKKALVIVDAQVGVLAETWEAERIIENIGRAVKRARANNVPVIWVQHDDDELIYDSPEWQLAPGLAPREGEPVIHKHYNSSFEETTLDETLGDLETSHIILGGAATNWCVRATAYGALDRGYDLTLLKDAHTTESMEFQGGYVIEAESIVTDLNTVMRWVSYPGRSSSASEVDEVEFTS